MALTVVNFRGSQYAVRTCSHLWCLKGVLCQFIDNNCSGTKCATSYDILQADFVEKVKYSLFSYVTASTSQTSLSKTDRLKVPIMYSTRRSIVLCPPFLFLALISLLGGAPVDAFSNPFDEENDGLIAPRTADYDAFAPQAGSIPPSDFSVMSGGTGQPVLTEMHLQSIDQPVSTQALSVGANPFDEPDDSEPSTDSAPAKNPFDEPEGSPPDDSSDQPLRAQAAKTPNSPTEYHCPDDDGAKFATLVTILLPRIHSLTIWVSQKRQMLPTPLQLLSNRSPHASHPHLPVFFTKSLR
jgi:hypothetical protein